MSDSAPPTSWRIELAPGYEISRVIHGGWQLSTGHRPTTVDDRQILGTLGGLADAGFTTFDCADIYTGVEEILGRFLARRPPGSIQVHTKLVPDADVLATITREYVEGIVDRSLRRLGVERLDLVQLHWWDYGVPGYVETADWLAELRQAGKIRLLGATNFDVPRLAEILDAGVELATHQVQLSLLDRRPHHGMIDLCERRGVRLLCYGTLAGGFLTHRFAGAPEPQPPLANRSLVKYRLIIDELGGWSAFQHLLGALREVAVKHRADVATIASRWSLEQPSVGAVIVGIGRGDYLASTRQLFDVDLDREDRERLAEAVADARGPAGDVYSLERVPGGPHAVIMRTRLNREPDVGG